jgi:hypothetical protein
MTAGRFSQRGDEMRPIAKSGSPALLMKTALVRFGMTENPLENRDCHTGWRPWIIERAGEPLFRFSRTFDDRRSWQSRVSRERSPEPLWISDKC